MRLWNWDFFHPTCPHDEHVHYIDKNEIISGGDSLLRVVSETHSQLVHGYYFTRKPRLSGAKVSRNVVSSSLELIFFVCLCAAPPGTIDRIIPGHLSAACFGVSNIV